MTVYLDDWKQPRKVGIRSAVWSRLTADSETELRAFAAELGLSARWWRGRCTHLPAACNPCPHWHYLAPESRRPDVLAAGAQPVDAADWGVLVSRRTAQQVDAAS